MNIISSDGSILVNQQDCTIDLKAKPPIGGINTGPSPSFLFNGNGGTTPLIGTVRLSGQSGNTLLLNPDGLYSPVQTFTESLITTINSTTINLAATGMSGHTLQADLKISTTAGNALIIKSDGVYVPNNSGTGSGSYTDAQARNAISGLAPIVYNKTTGVISISLASASNSGYLSSTDWITFNSKEPAISLGNTSQYWRGDKTWQLLNTTVVPEGTNQYFTAVRARSAISSVAPITYNPSTGVIGINLATGSSDGYLSSTDYTTFNSKIGTAVSLASVNAKSIYKDTIGTTLEFRGVRGDNVTITATLVGDDVVLSGSGVVPIANAGADKGVILPTTSVTMTGVATTSAGTIVSTTWLLMSGPSAYSISDATSLNTTVTGLVQGTYVFRLVVVNSFGLVDTDDVTIAVSGTVSTLDTIYIGSAGAGTTPTQSQILAGNSSQQNGAFNVLADWTSLTSGGPTYCFFAIPDTDAAHEKNKWFVDTLNNGNIGTPDDLFGALATVVVDGVNYSVGITNYQTQFTNICQLQKV